uniref:Uncharacterized protein n=1 Tax=Rhizophora mucronata TaxID=61149 RepID=A0A2P2PZM8_RHIMU
MHEVWLTCMGTLPHVRGHSDDGMGKNSKPHKEHLDAAYHKIPQ